jgi:hypothetical protein
MNKRPQYISGALLLFSSLMFAACASSPEEMTDREIRGRAQGLFFGSVEVRPGTAETAPYLPGKIRFELIERLEARGLLSPSSAQGQGLMVLIDTTAYYPAFARGENYSRLESRVLVRRPSSGEILAETVIRGYSSSGAIQLDDFTEITLAKGIADFLEDIVR